MGTCGVFAPGQSKLPGFSLSYVIPALITILTMTVDVKEISKLGYKSLAMFFSGSIGITLGAPIALIIFNYVQPSVVEGDNWKGISVMVAGWIGAFSNIMAVREAVEAEADIFAAVLIVTLILGLVWLAIVLAIVPKAPWIDNYLGADASAIDELRDKMKKLLIESERIPSSNDYLLLFTLPFFVVSISTALASEINKAWPNGFGAYFWIVVLSSTIGLGLSFIPTVRNTNFAGAPKIVTIMIYVLCVLTAMDLNLFSFINYPGLLGVGVIILIVHGFFIVLMARILRAPTFFICVGSHANIGSVASAPIVAGAFDPCLAPVGAMTAILGNLIGTYCAILAGLMMEGLNSVLSK